MDKIRNNIKTIVLIGITLLLAGAAVFTAWRLYETRFQAIAPTAPESVPADNDDDDRGGDEHSGGSRSSIPQTSQCSTVTFTLASAPTAGPTAAPTAAPTAKPTSAPSAAPTATASSSSSSSSTGSSSSSSSKGGSAATATPSTQLPDAGVSWPTIGAAVGGFILVIAAALLAF